MAQVELNGNRIRDWSSFFKYSAEAFGRPDLAELSRPEDLGKWIGMLSDAAGDEESGGAEDAGEELRIEVEDTERFAERAPEVLTRFVWAVAWVNRQHGMVGRRPHVMVEFR
jgi:hypothetical protein